MTDITTEIAGCQITEKIYAGSRTLVYKGIDLQSSASVVIKLMRNEYPSFGEIVQFKNQYTITKNLDIVGVVKPLKLETYQNRYVILMEDFGGISLKEYAQQYFQGVLPLNEFFPIAIKIASIIDSIHHSRIIHKDIKPENILINPQSQEIKVTDFGIASQLLKESQTSKSPTVLEGTLAYISPEQTGRMNRGIDYRSDYYSLGVTFYELLTGSLPFNSKDAMELVHCHIAKQSIPVNELSKDIPVVLSNIVSKLMAKNAEDRYQSLLGLRYDLERCANEFKNNNFIENFPIGSRDSSDNFIIPEKLYGREKEVETILQVFNRVTESSPNNYQTELILVAGISGIGKTAIVNEVHKPIVSHRGYFAKGKFDQFQRNIPLSAFVQVFRDLIGQLLSESNVRVAEWKDKILEVLGNQGQLIIEVIPELEFIIGKQPPVTDLSDNAAQNRFNLLFDNFIKIFAKKEHPLVIFIDDLQWADFTSLQLIKLLMNSQKQGCLLLIGAYRDSEVYPGHPFVSMLEEIQKIGEKIHTITLVPLNQNDINNFIADTFNYTVDTAKQLTELVYQKAKGNPFFTTQFLKFLHEEECIVFDYQGGSWLYNIEKIRELAFDEDVVQFMALQLQKLPKETQDILKLSACIGNQFDLTTLAIVSNQSPEKTSKNLWEALREGLVIPINDDYKFYQHQNLSLNVNIEPENKLEIDNNCTANYQFLHDRVQQAAYSLIPEEEKQTTHLKIGKLLLQNTLDSQREENIFSLLTHLNQSVNLITDPLEREELAKLNRIASQRAKTATAYNASLEYAITGIKLLLKKHWLYQYELSLSLYNLATETSYLSGSYEKIEDFAQQVLQNARTDIDKIRVLEARISTFFVQGKLGEGISLGLKTLSLLGVEINEAPTEADIGKAFAFTDSLMPKENIESLKNLPLMTDAKVLATIQILASIAPVAFIYNPSIHIQIVLWQVNQCIIYGNTALSSIAYSSYGMLLCGIFNHFDAGYNLSNLALEISTQYNNKYVNCEILFIAGACINHWKRHLCETIPLMSLAANYGLESGNFSYVASSYLLQCEHLYFIGEELTELEGKIKNLGLAIRQIKQEAHYNHHQSLHQLIINLTSFKQSCVLVGEVFDEEQALSQYKAINNGHGEYLVYFAKLQLSYLFGQYTEAVINSNSVRKRLVYATSLASLPVFYLYDSLTQLAICHTLDDAEKTEAIKHVKDNQEKMHFWAKHAPENCLHKWYIVEAEICRVLLQKNQAIEYYDCAINLAKENKYLQEEALACELAAKLYLGWNKKTIARSYMLDAYQKYQLWGAKAKVLHLEKNYPQLIYSSVSSVSSVVSPISTNSSFSLTGSTSTEILDLSSILKASQTLAQEIKLDILLAKMMRIVIENAGAERGYLMLNYGDDYKIVTSGESSKVNVTLDNPIVFTSDSNGIPILPNAIINYVIRTKNNLVLSDASYKNNFTKDAYISYHKPKSVLCFPLLNQGKLTGIIYLENNLVSGVFTDERLEILCLLSTQAAISIENATIYNTLETKVQERTQELSKALNKLQQTQSQLVQSEKMSALGQMVAGVAHEINNPANFIHGNLDYVHEYTQDLVQLLQAYQEYCPNPPENIQQILHEIDIEFLSADLSKIISSMQTGTQRIREIVLSLRNFSRLDEAEFKVADIHEGLDNTLMLLQHRLDESKIEIIKEYSSIPLVECYAAQLNQVFFNILTNAIDAIEESKQINPSKIFTIWVYTELVENTIIISIADNGIGIQQNIISKIFDPFFTTKPVGKGAGLGLSMSYQTVVVKHNGNLWCDSTHGLGSKFVIEIPIKTPLS